MSGQNLADKEPKNKKHQKFNYAIEVSEDFLLGLQGIILKYSEKIQIEFDLLDGSKLIYQSAEEAIKFKNPQNRKITKINISSKQSKEIKIDVNIETIFPKDEISVNIFGSDCVREKIFNEIDYYLIVHDQKFAKAVIFFKDHPEIINIIFGIFLLSPSLPLVAVLGISIADPDQFTYKQIIELLMMYACGMFLFLTICGFFFRKIIISIGMGEKRYNNKKTIFFSLFTVSIVFILYMAPTMISIMIFTLHAVAKTIFL